MTDRQTDGRTDRLKPYIVLKGPSRSHPERRLSDFQTLNAPTQINDASVARFRANTPCPNKKKVPLIFFTITITNVHISL